MSSIFGRSTSAPSAAASSSGQLSQDITLSSPPDDSISDLSWSPTANNLAVASWDSKVRVYDLIQNSSGVGKAAITFDGPVLSCAWSKNGQQVAGAGADKTARLLDLGANGAPAQQVSLHDAPIRSLRFIELPNANAPMIVTGSWDKTVKYWDLRQPTAAATLNCQDKIYAMDVKDQLLVIATAERYVNVVNLTDPTRFFKTQLSPLTHQTRVISCFIDSSGWAIGSTEGRCSFHYINPKPSDGNFSFKCHRSPVKNNVVEVYSVNAISFHPTHTATFSTAGADGTFQFWDKDTRRSIHRFDSVGAPISATAFNKDGTTFAYAVSYDWSKGYAHNSPQHVNKVMLHATTDREVKSNPSTSTKKY